MKESEISQYWNDKAEALKTDPSATMKDVILRGMEVEAIGSRLKADDELLDVGGGNAYAGLLWAEQCKNVLVTDFSEKMVEYGRVAITESRRDNINTKQASVLDLSVYARQYSAVTCVRCLINLTSQEEQLAGVEQLASALKPGGRLFLIEGLDETFAAMNSARQAMQLPAISLDWHNRLLPKDKLEAKLTETLTIEERVDFGEYYFLSRIMHPLLVAPEEPTFQGRCNQIARDVWRAGLAKGRFADMSTLVLYVCTKPRHDGA
ncbi:MAG: class I SAM-dependent methyltransferase [Phycisphaerae bacterium]|nr:class I SAM-dependent methyltransferase [Phycisphaerae bacterium]